MSIWIIDKYAKTNGRNALMVRDNANHSPIAEVKMPYIPNGTVKPTPDIEGQYKKAALIAAAPELLKALKGCYDDHMVFGSVTTKFLEAAREAIAKAEGGAA